ncbi:MAG: hypothetical protein AB1641_09745 [Thermodesulfobacteriota bacterium]
MDIENELADNLREIERFADMYPEFYPHKQDEVVTTGQENADDYEPEKASEQEASRNNESELMPDVDQQRDMERISLSLLELRNNRKSLVRELREKVQSIVSTQPLEAMIDY